MRGSERSATSNKWMLQLLLWTGGKGGFDYARELRKSPNFTLGCSTVAATTVCKAVVPPDLATIYNLNPLFSEGISGQGQTIVLIEPTNAFKTGDWGTFRSKADQGLTSGQFLYRIDSVVEEFGESPKIAACLADGAV